ncbi:MAG: tRNA (guanosine(37)-N1)-methyltransferase TrmD [Acutalibacteraceae bacterium]|nr:tRNA (guanosine(37)-N1)-methyltransferase TrmD [Acutalibacteraceae bacterium]
MKIDIMTLFPEMCETVLGTSIIGRARKNGKVSVSCVNIRDFADNKHKSVDDAPFGGGMGMVMAAQPIDSCFKSLYDVNGEKPYLIYMSPKGTTLTQKKAVELSQKEHIVFLCGHYEGIDQRVIDKLVDEEISIGDYVLTGGEIPALVCADVICRMLPGVLSDDLCFTEESHFASLLEYPQYTRPAVWEEREVPTVLLSGNHAEIAKWRREQSVLITAKRRPDMLKNAQLSEKEIEMLNKLSDDDK